MTDDLEVSPHRRPAGSGWWIDGRCGAVLLATLVGSLLFAAAFSLRGPDAAEEAPVFVNIVLVFRLLSYAWLGCVLAPLNWALRYVAVYIAAVLLLDALLLGYSLGLLGGITLGAPPFGSLALRVCDLCALAILGFAFARSMSGSFKAGVKTTIRFGRQSNAAIK